MIIYIALLRGINVGGKNIIKMAELKQALTSIGLVDVKTYIQSGNILFKSNETEDILRNKIETLIKDAFGLSISVVIRTSFELDNIISNCPFTSEEILKAKSNSTKECLYISFLTNTPSIKKINYFDTFKSVEEEYRIIGRDVFLLFHDSIRNSKLSNNLQKLDETATVRNWNTLNKIVSLAKEMDL